MYFVHPQIERKKILGSLFCFSKKPNLAEIEEKLSFFFPEKKFYFVDMARTAFKIAIEKLNLKNSQILIPAFICDIFFPILKKYKIEPVFLDIDLKTFNVKFEDIKNKISKKTKAILICHTFGLPHQYISEIYKISKNYKIHLLEDCAHSFGARQEGIFVGNFGVVSFFSLYKQFPTARGGLLVCPKDWEMSLKKTTFNLRDLVSFLNSISPFAFLFKKFGKRIAPKMMRKEKGNDFLAINDTSLNLFFLFLKQFEKTLEKRKNLAIFYQKCLEEIGFEVQERKNNVFCYLSALVPKKFKEKRDKIVEFLQKEKIFCTRTWKDPILLNKEAIKFWKVNPKEYPNTLEAAERIINFPLQNHFQKEEIKKIVSVLKKILSLLK
jgi:dTDP-4-amino-4,6-dideoxygalactose transaminase